MILENEPDIMVLKTGKIHKTMIQKPYHITSSIPPISSPWKIPLSILLGILMSFSFAPFGIWGTSLLALNGFFLLLFTSPSALKAGVLGCFFALGYFGFGASWISAHFYNPSDLVGWFLFLGAALALPLYASLFVAFFSCIAWVLGRNLNSLNRILLFSACFALSEWCLGNLLTRFPWQLMGYISYDYLPLMQAASIGGIYGLSFIIILTASSLSCLFLKKHL